MNNREIRAYNIAVQYEIKRQETVAWAPARIFAKGGIQPSLSSPSASLPFPYPPILLTPYYSPSLISVHPDVPFHPLNHARGSVVRCKLPQNRVRGKAPPPAANAFGYISSPWNVCNGNDSGYFCANQNIVIEDFTFSSAHCCPCLRAPMSCGAVHNTHLAPIR